MTRGEKIMTGLMIVIIAGIALLYWQQSRISREQKRLEKKYDRNPFIEPATNGSKTTAP